MTHYAYETLDLEGFNNDLAIISAGISYPEACKDFKKMGDKYFRHTDALVLGKIIFDTCDEQQVALLLAAANEAQRRVNQNMYWDDDIGGVR